MEPSAGWDLAQRYFIECLKLPASVLGGCGLVSNMLYNPKRKDLDKYFKEIPTTEMRGGDVVIWEYGHIAIFDHWDGKTNWYFSQNPNPCNVITISRGGAHAFRLKGEEPQPKPQKYNIGDMVRINGVYTSSMSTKKLEPRITEGTITNYLEGTRNPYLLDDGYIGWVNDDCIVELINVVEKTVCNCYWLNLRTTPSYGNNIYKAVPAGTKVEYIGVEDGWSKIKYDNRTLYCGSSYLK